jgi:hypothetical protein
MRTWWLSIVLIACGEPSSSKGVDAGDGPGRDAASNPDGGSNAIDSSLTSGCATLQGRAVVNHNGNLGIAFTESDSPFTFVGSVQFELPDGFTGAVPNPENWDGSSARRVVAMTTPGFELHGNHCWAQAQPPSGSVVIDEYRPSDGIVKATFTALPLHSCTGGSVCTVSGMIETTGEGVFD